MAVVLTVSSEGQGPQIRFGNSPTPSVRLSPFTVEQFPAFRDLFPPDASAVQPASFVLENMSDRRIVGIAVRYVVANQDGKLHNHDSMSDGFLSPGSQGVAAPHSRLLVAPGMFMPESLWSERRAFVGPGPANISAAAKDFTNASAIAVDVDSIIFEDGEVVGPDQLRLSEEIHARKAAAEALASQIRGALARGDDPRSFLSQLSGGARVGTDRTAKWSTLLAHRLRRMDRFDSMLSYLEGLPTPPNFFRLNKNQ